MLVCFGVADINNGFYQLKVVFHSGKQTHQSFDHVSSVMKGGQKGIATQVYRNKINFRPHF